jgi:DNA-binding MarR family transcriptional regulator
LKAAGLVKSEGDTQDARRIHVSATSKGRTLLQQARERRIQLLAETFAGVSGSEILILQKAAEIIEKAVQGAR